MLLPPGPPTYLSPSYFQIFRRSPLQLFTRLQAEYGDLAGLYFGPQYFCLIQDPELIRQILTRDHAQFKKGRFLELAKDLLGEGLLTSEGEHHRQQRLLIQPLFHRQMIRIYADVMVKWCLRFCERWQDGQVLDMAQTMMQLTLGIVGEALFGVDIESEASDVGQALEAVLDIRILGRPLQILTRHLPLASNQAIHQAKTLLNQTIQGIIQAQRQQSDSPKNLIGLLLAARDEAGQGMSDTQIRDEALTLLLAGHETTANALAWSWYLLAQSPRVTQQLEQELTRVIGTRAPHVDDLPHLTYTRQLMTESMRLYPPAWVIGRRTLQAYPLGSRYLPAGSIVIMSQFLMHRNSRYYPDPLQFRPERWTPEFKHALPKFAYFPFGGGPRNCIGEAFAWMEGMLLLACLAQNWRFELPPGHQVQPQTLVTLRPQGLQMICRRR